MLISIEHIRNELKSLFAVPPDHPRWATSELLNLAIVRNIAETFELPPTHLPFALVLAILLVINDQLVPTGPEAPLDFWKLLVACEIHFLGRLRRHTVMILSDWMAPAIWVRWEKLNQDLAYTPFEFLDLSDEQRAVVIRKALINLWVWKTQTNPFDQPNQLLWKQLHAKLSQAAVFSKNVIYENRTKLRDKVAQSLHQTQHPGMGNGNRIADYVRLASALQDKPLQGPKTISESPKSIQPLPAPPLPQPDTTPASQAAPSDLLPAADIQTIPEDFASLREWINARFKQVPVPIELVGVPEKARRLAQSLAAIALKVESGDSKTPRLVFKNVEKALQQVGIEPKQTDKGDVLLDFLVRAGFLVTVDDCREFVHPLVAQFFAAEYITQYGVQWVSLDPGYRRIMRWAATILAQRRDDPRSLEFFNQLKGLTRRTEIDAVHATFDYVDYLIEFRGFETPAVRKFRDCVIRVLKDAARIDSNRLRWLIWLKAKQLGEDVGLDDFSAPPETFIAHNSLVTIRASTNLSTLLNGLGTSIKGSPEEWLQSDKVVRALLAEFRKAQSDELKWQYAAWLQAADLSVQVGIKPNAWLYTPFTPFLTALEAIAQMAMDQKLNDFTRTLARGILTTEEFIIRLSLLGPDYFALIYTLELALGKRRWFNWKESKWELVPYSMKL